MKVGSKLRIAAAMFFSFSILAVFCFMPGKAVNGASDGLELCIKTVIPSLFPFFVASSFFIRSGAVETLGKAVAPVSARLFGISGECSVVPVMGFVGGYPVGAAAAVQLDESKRCTKREAETLLAFCNNSGPAFILGMAGGNAVGSYKAGALLMAVHILSALAVGFLFRSAPEPGERIPVHADPVSLSFAFTESVRNSVFQLLTVCGYIVFFSVIISVQPFEGSAKAVFCGIAELSNGIAAMPAVFHSLPALAAAVSFCLGWGGLSVHFQTLSLILPSGLSPKKYFIGKMLHALISAAASLAVFSVVNISETVFRTDTTPSVEAPVISSLGVLCCVLIITLYGIVYFVKKLQKR